MKDTKEVPIPDNISPYQISPEEYLKAYTDLVSEVCAACGGKKNKRKSFCYRCFYLLPNDTRKALYKVDDYAETYTKALKHLRRHKDQ